MACGESVSAIKGRARGGMARRGTGRKLRALSAPSGSVDDPEVYVDGARPSGENGRGYPPTFLGEE